MSMLTLIRRIISSSMKIIAAQFYVSGVKNLRILFLNILFVMLSFVLLVSGLFLIQTALFTYSQWSFQVKLIAALVLGGVELLGAIIILFYIFREENWVKFFGIQEVLDAVTEGKPGNKKE